ncbi:MAG: (2Fe-2S)-binding protein [Halofilum sp. (in: g-proteobacteria)]|nr:(2Fe-2S)-binding protein [Halofilum sp. (in: g-proteobacteria)]
MYICICQAVTDHEIRHAVRGGIISFEEMRQQLGVALCCGRCCERAEQVFYAALRQTFPPMPRRAVLVDKQAAAAA